MLKIRITTLIVLGAIILSACRGVTPYPAPSATFVPSTTTPLSTLTSTPAVTPTFQNTPTPETLYGYSTPEAAVWPTCVPMMDCLQLTPNVQRQDISLHQLYVGKYVLRSWCNIDPQFPSFSPCAVTISSKGNKQIEIWGYPAYFREETGADLTGDGKPDIVITDWGGGNCCVETLVYEADANLIKIIDVGSHWDGVFTDLNGDGTYEYIAVDRIWSGICEECAVWPSIVYEYRPKLGYAPVTYKFKDVLVPWGYAMKSLSTDIQGDLDFLDQFTKQNPNMTFLFFPTNLSLTPTVEEQKYWQYANENSNYSQAVNSVYELAAYYLLAGQQADAQKILNKYFPLDKASEYLLGIKNDLQGLIAP